MKIQNLRQRIEAPKSGNRVVANFDLLLDDDIRVHDLALVIDESGERKVWASKVRGRPCALIGPISRAAIVDAVVRELTAHAAFALPALAQEAA